MRDLFYFCGQSNMLGASVFPAVGVPKVKEAEEYKYAPIYRDGKPHGEFLPVSYDAGEFLYIDNAAAYAKTDAAGRSLLTEYQKNCYTTTALCTTPRGGAFDSIECRTLSESSHLPSVSLLPLLCEEWEALGERVSAANFSKGGAIIEYFTGEAAPLLRAKGEAFLRDAAYRYGEGEIGKKVFLFLQGESDSDRPREDYTRHLELLYRAVRGMGFDLFGVIRVGYWYQKSTAEIMRAQEEFCNAHEHAAILTRAMSFMTDTRNDADPTGWYTKMPPEEYRHCRDSFAGFGNQHINAAGFRIVARKTAKNLYRMLREGKPPILEEELVPFGDAAGV